MDMSQGGGTKVRYFQRYQADLTDLIGREAAANVAAMYKWTLTGFACLAVFAGLAISESFKAGYGTKGWDTQSILAALLFLATIPCGVMAVRRVHPGARAASSFLSRSTVGRLWLAP